MERARKKKKDDQIRDSKKRQPNSIKTSRPMFMTYYNLVWKTKEGEECD